MAAKKHFRAAHNSKVGPLTVTPALLAAIQQDADDNFATVPEILSIRLATTYKKKLPPTPIADARRETIQADLLLKKYKAARIAGRVCTIEMAGDLYRAENIALRHGLDLMIQELVQLCPGQKETINSTYNDALNRM